MKQTKNLHGRWVESSCNFRFYISKKGRLTQNQRLRLKLKQNLLKTSKAKMLKVLFLRKRKKQKQLCLQLIMIILLEWEHLYKFILKEELIMKVENHFR